MFWGCDQFEGGKMPTITKDKVTSFLGADFSQETLWLLTDNPPVTAEQQQLHAILVDKGMSDVMAWGVVAADSYGEAICFPVGNQPASSAETAISVVEHPLKDIPGFCRLIVNTETGEMLYSIALFQHDDLIKLVTLASSADDEISAYSPVCAPEYMIWQD